MPQTLEQKIMADQVIYYLGNLRRDIRRNGAQYSANLDQGMDVATAATWISLNCGEFERNFAGLRNLVDDGPRFAKLSSALNSIGITPNAVDTELTALETAIATVKAMPRTTDPEIRAISAWVDANVTAYDRPLEEPLPPAS